MQLSSEAKINSAIPRPQTNDTDKLDLRRITNLKGKGQGRVCRINFDINFNRIQMENVSNPC